MTIGQSFIKFLESQGCGVFGQDLFLIRVPNSLKTKTNIFWVTPSGGNPVQRNKTKELIKSYSFIIHFRSQSAREVDERLFALEKVLNCMSCVNLEEFNLVSIKATQFGADQDLDSEDRMIGTISVQIEVYENC